MLKIVIGSTPLRTIAPQPGGKQFKPFHVQEAGIHTLDKEGKPHQFAQRIELQVDRPEDSYAPGEYTADFNGAVYIDQRGRLALGRPKLTPLKK